MRSVVLTPRSALFTGLGLLLAGAFVGFLLCLTIYEDGLPKQTINTPALLTHINQRLEALEGQPAAQLQVLAMQGCAAVISDTGNTGRTPLQARLAELDARYRQTYEASHPPGAANSLTAATQQLCGQDIPGG